MVYAQLFLDGLATGVVFVLLCTGLVLITSVCRILFMAYGIFYTIGAYTTWYLAVKMDVNFFPSLICGALFSGLIGGLVYIILFRYLQGRRGAFLATLIASMGLMMFLQQASILIYGTQNQGIPTVFEGLINVGGVHFPVDKLALIVISIAFTVILFLIYEKTSVGRKMRTVAFLPQASHLFGINKNAIFMVTLMLGTGLAGLSGGLMAPIYGINITMGNNIIWLVILIVMLGGMDSLLGAVVGGICVGQILSFGQYFLHSSVQIILFIIIGIVVYYRPQGLLGRGVVIDV
jgi:branched-chain amino acid transport system permease protein